MVNNCAGCCAGNTRVVTRCGLQLYAEAITSAAYATPGRVTKPKTPRCEAQSTAGSGSRSPNERVRKMRRSGPAFGASPGECILQHISLLPM